MRYSNQTVLNYHAGWMEERFRKAYTDEDFEKLSKRSLEVLEDIQPEELDAARAEASETFSLENLARQFREDFPEMYSSFEQATENRTIHGINLDSISERARKKYIEPYEQCCKKMTSLVDKIRARFYDIFPGELSEKDIEGAFKEAFPKPEDYPNFIDAATEALLLLESFEAAREEADAIEYLGLKMTYDAVKEIYRNI